MEYIDFVKRNKVTILISLIIIGILMTSPIGGSFIAMITGNHQLCSETPYDKDCYCKAGENKKGVAFNGVQTKDNPIKYYCENVDLLLDPDSLTFKQEALNFAQDYLSNNYPDCNSIYSCPVEPQINAGYYSHGKRDVTIKCTQEQAGSVLTFWYLWVDIETHKVSSSMCSDLRDFEPEEGDGRLEISYMKEGPGTNMFSLRVNAKCVGKKGMVYDEYVYTLEEYLPDASGWTFHGDGDSTGFCGDWGTCNIIEKNKRSVKIVCSGNCTGKGDCGASGLGIRYSLESYGYNCFLVYSSSRSYKSGSCQVCCPNDKYFRCTENGWLEVDKFRECTHTTKDFEITSIDGSIYVCNDFS